MTPDKHQDNAIKAMKNHIEHLQGQERMQYLLGLNDGIMTCAELIPAVNIHPRIASFHQYVLDTQGKSLKDKHEDRSSQS